MDETRERFLQAIVARLGAERIVELHLFSPLRQGVSETGVAVIAVLPDLVGAGNGEGEGAGNDEGEGAGSSEGDEAETMGGGADADADALVVAQDAEPSPYLDASAAPVEEVVVGIETPAESRHVVFTALYRLTRKGPDRGKWFFEVVAQADAPLAGQLAPGDAARFWQVGEAEALRAWGEQKEWLKAGPEPDDWLALLAGASA